MAILLRDQLVQEIVYHTPIFGKKYYADAHDNVYRKDPQTGMDVSTHKLGKRSGNKMFWDFYAIDQLWRAVGSGKYSQEMRASQRGMPETDPSKYFHTLIGPGGKKHSAGGEIVPQAVTDLVDKVHDQVVRAVAKNLITYVRLAVIQEFQYLISSSDEWTHFRQSLASAYNNKHTISKEDFQKIVKKYIPDMARYPDTLMRLLKFSKYFSEMKLVNDIDPYDAVKDYNKKEPAEEPKEVPTTGNDEPSVMPGGEPDDTDYGAEPIEPEIGKYGGPGQPESPYKKDWSGMSAFNEPPEDEKEEEPKESYLNEQVILLTEERIELSKILKVYSAMKKSGVTLDDIQKAYNDLSWGGGGMGGPKWGDGAIALIKLMDAKKTLDTEDYIHIIDHIYDLQHNTGSLLNKGPMDIDDESLNIRYRTTHPARFLDKVSPMIRNLLVRYMKYFPGTDPELELNKNKIVSSPTTNFSPEEVQYLLSMRFTPGAGSEFDVPIQFIKTRPNKSPQDNRWIYTIKKHTNGMISLADDHGADVQVFQTFPEAQEYINRKIKNEIVGADGYSAEAKSSQSQKQKYISDRGIQLLPKDEEIELLKINMGRDVWGNKFYEAHFPGAQRFQLFAFTDGTFLTTWRNKEEFQVHTNWIHAYKKCESVCQNANDFPNKEEKLKALMGIPSSTPKIPSMYSDPDITPPPSFKMPPGTIAGQKYYLEDAEITTLKTLMAMHVSPGVKYEVVPMVKDGFTGIFKNTDTSEKAVFYVGHKINIWGGSGLGYKIEHPVANSVKEQWSFPNFAKMIDFIDSKFDELVLPIPLASMSSAAITPTAYIPKALPPNSATKASYSAHLGLSVSPKNSIRLTKEDEDLLKVIGFEPHIISGTNSVWYIHNKTKDGVKFFPNNTAKLSFTGQASAGIPMVNMDIPKMLAWLPTKYKSDTSQSPFAKSAAPAAPQGGIQVSSMFSKKIIEAGFKWDASKGQYVNGMDAITIHKDRSSDLYLANVKKEHFNTMPALFVYLDDYYKIL